MQCNNTQLPLLISNSKLWVVEVGLTIGPKIPTEGSISDNIVDREQEKYDLRTIRGGIRRHLTPITTRRRIIFTVHLKLLPPKFQSSILSH